jgi:steroid 5-alpha reductase family enzyme
MLFLSVYLAGLAVILAIMFCLWVVSLIIRNSSIVDIFWGTGFVIAAWLYTLLASGDMTLRRGLIDLLVTIWGLRLSIHILRRNWGKTEDFRYRKWREEAGSRWSWISLFRVFLLQGVLLWIISAPLAAAQVLGASRSLMIFDGLGIALWLIGFSFEAVGDYQLARFLKNPSRQGKVLDSGVWRYTRHPNYFGDSAQWWGYYLIAAAAGGWWAFFSPILMTLFLVRVSGMALLEKTMSARPEYREYMKKTSGFIPWFPRKSTDSDQNHRKADE